jgi:hypothetical protein
MSGTTLPRKDSLVTFSGTSRQSSQIAWKMCVALPHPLGTFAHSPVVTGVQSSDRRPSHPLVCWQSTSAGASVSSVSHGLTIPLFPGRCIYFLEPDTIIPPSAIRPPAPLLPRSHANSVSQPDAEPVILEPPVTTNPLLRRPVLPQAEINVIRTLSSRVNVLPVIARADTLTNERLSAIKMAIRRDLAEAGIGFGIFDLDTHSQSNGDNKTFNGLSNGSSSSPSSSSPTSPVTPSFLRLPYALISPDCYSHSDGVNRHSLARHELVLQYTPGRPSSPKALPTKLVRGRFTRNYRWGFLDVLDPSHSDFVPLRQAIYHHMQTLQKYTREYLYDKFRVEYMMQHHPGEPRAPQVNGSLPSLSTSRPILSIDAPLLHSGMSHHSALSGSRQLSVVDTHVPPINSALSDSGQENNRASTKANRQRAKKITVACNFCRCMRSIISLMGCVFLILHSNSAQTKM